MVINQLRCQRQQTKLAFGNLRRNHTAERQGQGCQSTTQRFKTAIFSIKFSISPGKTHPETQDGIKKIGKSKNARIIDLKWAESTVLLENDLILSHYCYSHSKTQAHDLLVKKNVSVTRTWPLFQVPWFTHVLKHVIPRYIR